MKIGTVAERQEATAKMVTGNLGDIIARAKIDAAGNIDRIYKAAEISPVASGSQIGLKSSRGIIAVSRHGQRQIFAMAGIPNQMSGWFLDPKNGEFARFSEEILPQAWERSVGSGKELLIRCRKQDDSYAVRGVLTDKYGILDTVTVLEQFRENLPHSLKNCQVIAKGNHFDRETGAFRGQVILPETIAGSEADPHHRGLMLANGEVGDSACHLSTFLWRLWCKNGAAEMINGERSRITHKGDPVRGLANYFNKILNVALDNKPSEDFKAYWNTRDTQLDAKRIQEILPQLASTLGLSQRLAQRVVDEKLPTYLAETGYTLYSVVNSLTEFARDLESQEAADLVIMAAHKLVSRPALVRAFAVN